MVDEKDFFREATLRICGSLEIEKALWNCFMFIRDYIPADMMLMSVYDPSTGFGEMLAMADVRGGRIMTDKIPVTPEIRRIVDERIKDTNGIRQVLMARHIAGHPILVVFSDVLGPNSSAMAIEPKPEWNLYGAIVIANRKGTGYSEEHIRLFSLLNRPCAIALSNYKRYRDLLRLKEILADDNRYLRDELRKEVGEEIVGAAFCLKHVMDMVSRVAPLSSPVLLLGETGVGKEVIAAAIHNQSSRRNKPFVKVDCGAIPESLVDSELFGHEKGAFTGAQYRKRGRFERVQGGTVFLDEIGELTEAAQVRLLRVIQDKEIERVGGTESISLDIRIIAATHRNLETMIADGKFREDLYFRICVFPIVIPPLRGRRADIPALVQHFMKKKAREMGLREPPTLARGSLDRLIQYDWPGNVRELQNAVERAIILSGGKPLTFDDLGESKRRMAVPSLNELQQQSLDQVVSRLIVQALETAKGRIGGEHGAAKLLDINPSTLRSKMRKLGIPFGRKSRQKGVSEARSSRARREGTAGCERMQDPVSGKIHDMPLDAYHGALDGYRNPERPGEPLVKPRAGK